MLKNRTFAIILLAALSMCTLVLAGPPLICHSINVPEGQSLPWGKDAFTESGSYDARQVVHQTLELLKPQTQVLTRMETLRRAALYIDRDKSKADELLGQLMARALDSEASGKPDAMAWFDAGYFAQCLNQTSTPHSFKPGITKGVGASSVEGYSWVAKAITIAGSSPDLELAAALMTIDGQAPEHEQHLQAAIKGFGRTLPEESKRLLAWIAQINGSTLEQLSAKYGRTDDACGNR